MSSEETVTLSSSDGQEFTVSREAALLSDTIKHLQEDTGSEAVVPLPNVHSRTLSKVLEYTQKHAAANSVAENGNDDDKQDKELEEWDKNFIAVDQAVLYELILAANYLNIKGLLDLCCKTVADIIKGKTPQEIREYFHIENDFTPEEEEEVRRENQWAFE